MLCEKECRPPIHRDMLTVGLQVAAFRQHPFRYPKAGKDEGKQDEKGQQGHGKGQREQAGTRKGQGQGARRGSEGRGSWRSL
ncbi:BQ5605_C005g03563 [Microbotryum silenes-dioicae]|uniref:BQ5605_C005g03563 protein n=1 Tax=Microbotryum silenes-dioicae TaxID=796604 RepID=A0A2X0P6V0_9BASI|nr:BQ5605_C005g03563 [Microbotryum silenes-dioicae]